MKLPLYYVCFTVLPILFSISHGDKLFCPEEIDKYNAKTCLNNSTRPANDMATDGILEINDATSRQYATLIDREFTLYCCFDSKQYCRQVRWYKDGVELIDRIGGVTIHESGMRLNGIATIYVTGNYTCNATLPWGEFLSHTIEVTGSRACLGKFSVEPRSNRVEVKKGSRVELLWYFVCAGAVSGTAEVICRDGKRNIVAPSSYYNISSVRASGGDELALTHKITILNFTRTDNITCTTSALNSPFATRYLVESECSGSTRIDPPDTVVKALAIGSNYTMTCSFTCLKRRHFDDLVWRDGDGNLIVNNTMKYQLNRRDLSRGGFASFTEPFYEISLTVFNFTRNENFSCHLSETSEKGRTFSLIAEEAVSGDLDGAESFFLVKGVWIVVAASLLLSLMALLLWYRKKKNWKPQIFYRPNKKEVATSYDAFVSYSEADGGSFVRSTLKPMLEDECGYTLSLHYREFVPGTAIIDNIIDSIYQSRRIVTVVTPNFLRSEWCRFEVDQGLHRAIETPNTLVVIMLNEMPLDQLPKSLRVFLSKVNFLQWDNKNLDEMRKKLKRALGPPFTINVDHELSNGITKPGGEIEQSENANKTGNRREKNENLKSVDELGSNSGVLHIV